MTPPNIPLLYRIFHLHLEPLMALFGAYQAYATPAFFLLSTAPPSVSTAFVPSASNTLLLTNIAALYTFLALTDAILLRLTSELRVWKGLLFSLLVCDCGHLFAIWQSLGLESKTWAGVGSELQAASKTWNSEFVIGTAILALGPFIRAAFLLGVGLPAESGSRRVKGRRG